ncbi:hypothetical protein IE81DRAFT_347312 [Ceraceosorus guamensis]|uniref:Uncharacterized protein n=1 Tax=Ceraceosorus guamensis TaxID=1522189 RepID=A0A316VY60_9BASI|nr:hypothetical protein IE81DRAFT_347312 [Ceraceosorus guamensis]PWN42566.1 hypothetical protein IE81DRAFT_347312 [Ceraceosorus guamensis]
MGPREAAKTCQSSVASSSTGLNRQIRRRRSREAPKHTPRLATSLTTCLVASVLIINPTAFPRAAAAPTPSPAPNLAQQPFPTADSYALGTSWSDRGVDAAQHSNLPRSSIDETWERGRADKHNQGSKRARPPRQASLHMEESPAWSETWSMLPDELTPRFCHQRDDRKSSAYASQLRKRAHIREEAFQPLPRTPSSVAQLQARAPFPTPRPSKTMQPRGALLSTLSNGRTVVPSAWTSGLASSWRPQDRSVWFQKKAVIIVSIFLAIFIVLIIGAAVFLRDRASDDDELEEYADADDLAVERMREEREMRNAGRGAGGEKPGWKQKRQEKRDRKRQEKELRSIGSASKEASTGSSTAVSRRVVSRWIRAPANRLLRRASDDAPLSEPRAIREDDDGGRRSIASRPGSAHRRNTAPRLGDGRGESVEVVYDDDAAGADHERPGLAMNVRSRGASDPATLDSSDRTSHPLERRGSGQRAPSPSVDLRTGYSSSLSPSSGRRLDQSDLNAADTADQDDAEVTPPAYIPSRERNESTGPSVIATLGSRVGSRGGPEPAGLEAAASSSFHRPLAGDDDAPPLAPTLDRALAGRGARAEKQPERPVDHNNLSLQAESSVLFDDASRGPSQPGAAASHDSLTPFEEAHDALAEGPHSAHVATDDKSVLAAMRAAASAPRAGSSAPGYGASDMEILSDLADESGGHALLGSAAPSAPSAPPLTLTDDDFERLSSTLDVDAASVPEGSWSNSADREIDFGSESKGKAAMRLPPPPAPSAGLTQYEMPRTSDAWSASGRGTGSSLPPHAPSIALGSGTHAEHRNASARPSAPALLESEERLRRAEEKRREAEAELTIVASSPSDLAQLSRQEHAGTGGLPAYERNPSHGSNAALIAHGAAAPSAPPIGPFDEEGSLDGVGAEAFAAPQEPAGARQRFTAQTGETQQPSAPPLD